MLDRLIEYAHKHNLITEPGFTAKTIRWAIEFDSLGNAKAITDLSTSTNKKGKKFPCCPFLAHPELVKGGKEHSHFLYESAQTALLFMKEGEEKTNTRGKHSFFLKMLGDASEVIPALVAIVRTISTPAKLAEIAEMLKEKKVKSTENITFAIDGKYLLESDVWHDWWRQYRKEHFAAPKQKIKRIDFITGNLVIPALTHPKIELPAKIGGRSTGDALFCFDKRAFRSYGLKQSNNTAVSEETVAAYRSALNDLIEKGKVIIETIVCHWFKEKVKPEDNPILLLDGKEEKEESDARARAKELLEAIKLGKRPDLQNNFYYALTLSSYLGRIMIRDWGEGQFETLVNNINQWFDDLAILHRSGKVPSPKFFAVLAPLAPRDSKGQPIWKQLPESLVSKLWHIAIHGESIPWDILSVALERAKIDALTENVPKHACIGLIKTFLNRKVRKEGGVEIGVELNENHPNPAYHCGRLMAVLASLQRQAIGDNIKAGIVQRFYATASTFPASVFGRIVQLSQFHLIKVRKETPGLGYWYRDKIAKISDKIKGNFPKIFTLEEQGIFALGYYQQISADRIKKEKKEKGGV